MTIPFCIHPFKQAVYEYSADDSDSEKQQHFADHQQYFRPSAARVVFKSDNDGQQYNANNIVQYRRSNHARTHFAVEFTHFFEGCNRNADRSS